MKKLVIVLIIFILLGLGVFLFLFKKEKPEKKEEIIYTDALIDENIIIPDELNVEFGKIKKISDYIEVSNGTLNDQEIKYNDLGEVEVKFYYTDKLNMKNYRKLVFNIVDTTAPYVSVPSYKTVKVGTEISFIEDFFCGDNHDKNVERNLEGDFNLNEVGVYYVKYVAKDKSGNKTEKSMTLNVAAQLPQSQSQPKSPINYISYQDLYNQYKTKNTKVGIDISRWQGDVDFEKLKQSNVEFIMIRLGGQDGVDGEYYIDSKFKQNIEGAVKNGFDIGVYFYSYAYTVEEAEKQAKYVLDNLKGYDLKLPIVFDWECWNKFNKFNISFYDVTKVQDAFLNYVEKKGYKGSRYGSKNYLINAWQDSNHLTWLAHYISNTNYEGDYFMWQRCDTGKVDGINGAVDVDILYLDKYSI